MYYDRRLKKNQVLILKDEEGKIIDYWTTIKEAAEDLEVTKQTIYSWLDGTHRSYKIHGSIEIIDWPLID